MFIYNTLSGHKEPLVPPARGPLKLFVCGLTPYDYAHIGNARTYIVFDAFATYLRSRGLKVFYLQNVTDVDDKIIRRAREEGVRAADVAKKFEKAYHEDEKALGIDSVTKYAPATKYIKEITAQIQTLIDKGHAYKIEDDGWYFDIATFPEYGKLAKRTVQQAEDSVTRIDESIGKKNKGDFALWKFSKPGEPSWNTPLGEGRPGWHIEDTAITEKFFGPQYDIHGGGIDLKFPHHEAEIAQQEAASGKAPLAAIWMHAGHLLVNGQKMSKSLGNFITIRDFLKDHSAALLRFVTLSHHYRSPLDYSDELVRQSAAALDGIAQFLAKLAFPKKSSGIEDPKLEIENYETKFREALEDDFNTPGALAGLFGLIAAANPKIWNFDKKTAGVIRKWLIAKLDLFGITPDMPEIPSKAEKLANAREKFRAARQFADSDRLRKEIETLGYILEDTPAGPFLWPKKTS